MGEFCSAILNISKSKGSQNHQGNPRRKTESEEEPTPMPTPIKKERKKRRKATKKGIWDEDKIEETIQWRQPIQTGPGVGQQLGLANKQGIQKGSVWIQ
jgi:hypothetical protein